MRARACGAAAAPPTPSRSSARADADAGGRSYEYKFDGVLDTDVSQDEVFDMIAKEAIDSSLAGYNSTVFAYGQTGSGKTFTITGGAERYVDRGLIPRTLSYIFNQFKESTDTQYTAYISYLEIYNETGYDLLDPSHETKSLEELPRVTLVRAARLPTPPRCVDSLDWRVLGGRWRTRTTTCTCATCPCTWPPRRRRR